MISLFGPPEPTLLDKLKTSVSKTKSVLSETVDTILQGERRISPALLKELETALLSADLGVTPTREILEESETEAAEDAVQHDLHHAGVRRQQSVQHEAGAEHHEPKR